MKKIVLFLTLLLVAISASAEGLLQIYPSNVDFGKVLPGKTEERYITIENISSDTLNCVVRLKADSCQTAGAFRAMPGINNLEDDVYNLWPGETARVYFSYSPEVEAEEWALFNVEVLDTDVKYDVTLYAQGKNTRTLRYLLNDGKHQDYAKVDSITQGNGVQTVWINETPHEISTAAIDSVLFMITSQHFIPTISQRAYNDKGEDYEIVMKDNSVYLCEDIIYDVHRDEDNEGILYIENSERLQILNLKEGDMLYSPLTTDEFPTGLCYKIISVEEPQNAKRKQQDRDNNNSQGGVPEFYAFHVVPSSPLDNLDRFRQSIKNEKLSLNSDSFSFAAGSAFQQAGTPREYEAETEITINYTEILTKIFNKDFSALPSVKFNEEKKDNGDTEYSGELEYKKNSVTHKLKVKATLGYDKAMKNISVSFDKEMCQYDFEKAEVTYEYTITDASFTKRTGHKATVSLVLTFNEFENYLDYGYTLDKGIVVNIGGSVQPDLVGTFAIKEDLTTATTTAIGEKYKLTEDDVKYIKNAFDGKVIEVCGIPISTSAYGLDKLIRLKLGIWARIKLGVDGKFKVDYGLRGAKYNYNMGFRTVPVLCLDLSNTYVKEDKDNPTYPVLDIEGSLNGDLEFYGDIGLQLEAPMLNHGEDDDKHDTYIGAYITEAVTGDVSAKVNADLAAQEMGYEIEGNLEMGVDFTARYDFGIDGWGEVKSNYQKQITDLKKFSFHKFGSFTDHSIFNEYPAADNVIELQDHAFIRFSWKDLTKGDRNKKYEIYCGTSPDPGKMTLIKTIERKSNLVMPHFFVYNAQLLPGTYYWYVKATTDGGAITTSAITAFHLTYPNPYVDLGLPSGTFWCVSNIGTGNSRDNGNYLAWAETTGFDEGKSSFSWNNYKYSKGSSNTLTKYCSKPTYGNNNYTDNYVVLQPEDDVATAAFGYPYCIPTKEDWDELIRECWWSKLDNGVLVKSKKNGNVIFLPCAGYRQGVNLYDDGSEGYYWTSTLDVNSPDDAWFVYIGNGKANDYDYYRCSGRSVRPIMRNVSGSSAAKPMAPASTIETQPVEKAVEGGMVVKTMSGAAH